MPLKNNVINTVTNFYIFAGLYGLIVVNNTNERFYLFTVIYVGLLFFLCMFNFRKLRIPGRSAIDLLPMLFIFTWGYGFLIGLLKSNNISFALRNFSGLLLYFVFYLFIGIGVDVQAIKKIVCMIVILVAIFTPLTFGVVKIGHVMEIRKIPLLNCFYLNYDDLGNVFVMYYCVSFLIAGYAICLYKCVYNNKYLGKHMLGCVYFLSVIMVCSRCGGTEAALLGMTFIIIAIAVRTRLTIKLFLIAMFSTVFICLFLVASGINPFQKIFGMVDSGNIVRYSQINYILKNLSFVGKGLGAEYTSIGKGYAIEVQYLDMLYKFGIFSLVIYGGYLITFYKAIKLLKKGNGNILYVIPLALLGGNFIGLGNPVLFSTNTIFSHIVSLLLIKQFEEEKI